MDTIKKVRIGANQWLIGGGGETAVKAPEFDPEAEYSKGDLVFYEDELYAYKGQEHIENVTKGSVRGSFSPGDWEFVKDLHGAIWFNSTELQLQGLRMDGSSWRVAYPVFIQSVVTPSKIAGASLIQSWLFPVGRGAAIYIPDSLRETYNVQVIAGGNPLDVGLPVVELPEADCSYLDSEDVKEFILTAARVDGQILTDVDIGVLNNGVSVALAESSIRGVHTDLYGHLLSECTELVKDYSDSIEITSGVVRPGGVVFSEDIPVGDGLFVRFNAPSEGEYVWLVVGNLDGDEKLGFDYIGSLSYYASGYGMWTTESQRYIPRYIEVVNPYNHVKAVREIHSVCLYFRRVDGEECNVEYINQTLAIWRKPSGISIARNLKKNDPEAVRQFISVLGEWKKLYCPSHEIAEAPIGGLTFIDDSIVSNLDETSTDAASVLIAAMSGMSPADVVWRPSYPDDWKNPRYPWAENLQRYLEYKESEEVG